MKNFIIDLKVYPFDVMVSIGQNDNELLKSLLKIKWNIPVDDIKYSCNRTNAMFCLWDNGYGLIRLRNFPKTPEEKGFLAHEVTHYTNHLLDDIGMHWSKESDEAFSYLQQFITTEIYKRI